MLTVGLADTDVALFRSSKKFLFTVDGKSQVDDTTTLGYYMSLTAEVFSLLDSPFMYSQEG